MVAEFAGASAVDPDFFLTDSTGVILEGNFSSAFIVAGVVNLANATLTPTLLTSADITLTGGDTNLVNALGGMATLLLTGGLFDFSPDLGALGGDGDFFNSDFTFSGSGILTPVSAAPFVPQPSTGLLVGLGILGLAVRARRPGRRGGRRSF